MPKAVYASITPKPELEGILSSILAAVLVLVVVLLNSAVGLL